MKIDPKKIAAWSGAIAGVGGIVWAAVKAVLWAGALTTAITTSTSDIAEIKRMVAGQNQRIADLHERNRMFMRAELRVASDDRRQQAEILAAIQAEVRVRASQRRASPAVRAAVRRTDRAASMSPFLREQPESGILPEMNGL